MNTLRDLYREIDRHNDGFAEYEESELVEMSNEINKRESEGYSLDEEFDA